MATHPLHGPRVKVERAKSQLASLQRSQQEFFGCHPYEIGMSAYDDRTGRYDLRVIGGPEALPDEWGAVIGEIAHDLRSALDGFVWQLVKLDTGAESTTSQFPIFLYGPRSRLRSTPNERFDWESWRLRGVRRPHLVMLEALQPYKRGNRGRRNPLYLVHELNRVDKHRLIPVVVPAVGSIEASGISGGTELSVRADLGPNAKIGSVRPLPADGVETVDLSTWQIRTEHEARVDVVVTPGTAFGEGCRAVARRGVIRTLRDAADAVSSVVESFAGEFE